MTLDEAIQHAEEVADKCALTDGNILCENDHRQLAEWLTDYKRLLEQEPCEDAISRQAALEKIHWLGLDNDTAIKCDLAIRALSPVNTQEPCEDAISRQAVEEALYDYSRSCDVNYAQIMERIDALPSVTSKQRTGHWIMSDDGLYRPICDNCGAHPWKGYIPTVEEATKVFEYCPKCGAKMESEETQHADR